MKTSVVQIVFVLISTVFAAAVQDMWPTFGGVKPPLLLALVMHWAVLRRPAERSHREGPPFYAARWIPAAIFAGAFEDALSGFPSGCATGCFLLAGAAARFTRAAWPETPPRGWWIITRLWGRALRLPSFPATSRTAAIEAAIPVQMV